MSTILSNPINEIDIHNYIIHLVVNEKSQDVGNLLIENQEIVLENETYILSKQIL